MSSSPPSAKAAEMRSISSGELYSRHLILPWREIGAVLTVRAYRVLTVAKRSVAVPGHHVTLAITNPRVSAGGSLQMQVYDSSGANDANGTVINTSPTEIDFTPTAAQAGRTTVVISNYGGGAIGSFTLTYKA
jgi:hypothetical protein